MSVSELGHKIVSGDGLLPVLDWSIIWANAD